MNYEDRVTKQYIEDAIANAGVKFQFGSYVGNDAASHIINLPFTPKVVAIFPQEHANVEHNGNYHFTLGGMFAQGLPLYQDARLNDHQTVYNTSVMAEVTDGGFTVYSKNAVAADELRFYAQANLRLITYYYFAIG